MCVFSQACVKAEAQGNGPGLGKRGWLVTLYSDNDWSEACIQSNCSIFVSPFVLFLVFSVILYVLITHYMSVGGAEDAQSAFHNCLTL